MQRINQTLLGQQTGKKYIVGNNHVLAKWRRREGKRRRGLDDLGLFHLQLLWIYETGLLGPWGILIKKMSRQQILLRSTAWATALQFPLEV